MAVDSLIKGDTVYSVSQVTELVKTMLEGAFPRVWVEGEVSNYKKHTSGHVYFTLKDERSALRAVLFRSEARNIAFDLKDGLRVICRGRISVYEARGEYQIYVDFAEPKGKGALQLAFEQLREKLRAEGLFDEGRKRKLPLRPRTIGIVTSPTGAAIRDILRVLSRRYARLRILIYPARVQGEGAADEIVAGIDHLSRRPEVEVIIIGRGGGSIEDLWAFNEEKVARAVCRSPVPVISAVGHEVDFTIADFAADVRAPTPSAAAEMVIETEAAFRDRILNLEGRLGQLLRYTLEERRGALLEFSHHRVFQGFRVRLLNLGQRIDELETRAWKVLRAEMQAVAERKGEVRLFAERLRNSIRFRLGDGRASWDRLASTLHGLSPLGVLKKGYAICWEDGGLRVIQKIEDIAEKDRVVVSFYKGEFRARVETVDRERTVESRFLKEDE